jgi:hypothetical protein
MELEIVPLIAAIRRRGLHRALDQFGVNIPQADAFLGRHGYRVTDDATDIEFDFMSVEGMTLSQSTAHVHDIECRVDAALEGRA